MLLSVRGVVWYWRGPAPFYFVTVPAPESKQIKGIERQVTYGWGMIPVVVRIGDTDYATALWPKDGRYIVPIKAQVRRQEGIEEGDEVVLSLEVTPPLGGDFTPAR
ncbi:MAG TPA: DUF1905 domain-containing protein [Fimbriimonadaceae bacterium]|nr:DUF1905 domain-containing protein [Fimbriimonadaceae bacterium]HRJ95851.1 DUF1905 domain-containing protein [Fimbriimonadaceae bacterium]